MSLENPVTLTEQLLEGACDQVRRNKIEDAVRLLESAVEFQRQQPDRPVPELFPLIRKLDALVSAGAKFWSGWAAIVSQDANLYTNAGRFSPEGSAAASASHVSQVVVKG